MLNTLAVRQCRKETSLSSPLRNSYCSSPHPRTRPIKGVALLLDESKWLSRKGLLSARLQQRVLRKEALPL